MVSNSSRNGGDNMIGLNRRRTMGSKTALTPIERLRQLGCLMWFPLNSTYELNDIIGGRSITNASDSYFIANDSYYELRFAANTIRGTVDISDLVSTDFVDGNFTSIFQVRRYNSNRGVCACWTVNNIVIGSAFNSSGTTQTNRWSDDSWYEGVIVRHQDGTREVYSNQVLISNTPSTYPDIWDYSTIDMKTSNVSIFYAKNFLLFGKALTASEIAEVHQIIS